MPRVHETEAMIGFYGDDLDPDELTAGLGATPTVGVRTGATWRTARGVEKIASIGSWRIKAERSMAGDLEGQIRALLALLTADLAVWRGFAARYRAVAFVGLFLEEPNEGLPLSPDILLALGERGLLLDLDIYGGSAAQEE
jgi:hypothetical protein